MFFPQQQKAIRLEKLSSFTIILNQNQKLKIIRRIEMNKQVSWIFELTLTKGDANDLKKLMAELVESTKNNEPGTLSYEWTLNENNNICHIHERYADSNSALLHLKTFNEKFAARLMALGDATQFVVYGDPSDELKGALEAFGGTYMSPIGGFTR
jgi:quinol monooxygenase YgiN